MAARLTGQSIEREPPGGVMNGLALVRYKRLQYDADGQLVTLPFAGPLP